LWFYQPLPNIPQRNRYNQSSNSGYSSYDFDASQVRCGAWGGKDSESTQIKNNPVVFVHGNSDVAFGRGTTDGKDFFNLGYKYWQTGFRSLATYLLGKGYTKAELYTTTWGNGNDSNASNVYHSREAVTKMRKFLEAVLAYTGAKQIVVIGHSMGVSIGRRIVKGGSTTDHVSGTYSLGASLAPYVKTFVGLAGANLGLTACYSPVFPTCSSVDGFFPGATATQGPSTYLKQLQNDGKEGQKVYTIWSEFDDLIGYGCVVWGKITSRIPNQDGEVKKTSAEWNHFAVRDNTGPDLYGWL
jgi:triacylglycerol lipase